VYYCYDGLLRERPFEVIGYAITVFMLTLYILINYILEGEQDDVVKLVRWVWLGVLVDVVPNGGGFNPTQLLLEL